ncbi:MAG: prepilin-type N-terminal cleavage/methylation domain-containing protein [Pirellulaceae bacterium]
MMRIQRNPTHKRAFTLVELLVVMAVLVLLSSLVLSALAGAAEQARENRTRSQIQKIHELLMSRYEDYRYRRVPPLKVKTTDPTNPRADVRARQRDRVDKIRELIRMEMPSCREDLQFGPQVPASIPAADRVSPSLWNRYRRTVVRRTNSADFDTAISTENWTNQHQESECLYMILESIQDGDTNGLDFFRESEIGDIDGDGMPEILDGWGQPIIWIRWAPGHLGAQTDLHDQGSPDPFDPLGVRGGRNQDPPNSGIYTNYPLYPLIVSRGPDQDLHMVFRASPINAGTINNPYAANGDGVFVGTFATGDATLPTAHYDNITNHQLIIGGND